MQNSVRLDWTVLTDKEIAMGGKFSRDKGQRAERAVVKLLQPVVTHVYEAAGLPVPSLERNLMQSNKGGHDIVGLEWLALEVKHQETLHIAQWWTQAVQQAGSDKIPVLIFKQNGIKWRVMLPSALDAGDLYLDFVAEISLEDFIKWFTMMLSYKIK